MRVRLLLLVVAALTLAALWWPRTPAAGPCPEGTARAVALLPGGTAEWCERAAADGSRVKHGPYLLRHPSGRMKAEGAYRDGAKDGRWVSWHASGQKHEQGTFRQGREHGPWIRWHPNGQAAEAGEYRDGLRQGRWTFWHESARARKAREGEYHDDLEVGRWARWNVKGEPCEPAESSAPRV